ncbi:ABC transporter permease [Amycolatopsis sp.]|uniref:ABC transporter permease n=1 Tax=Amycolatopsis sp. TaxID=37632 RepID=UPI002CBECEE4|nr:ABC transporter permease [Amycolatopsis sp.]HVV10458.1 ABC transporter permease [Amycolatopsis sp.]
MRAARYLLHKVFLIAVVGLGVTTLLFVLSRLSGDPAVLMSPPEASARVISATHARLGLDQPAIVQYLDAVRGAFTFDFGQSFSFRRPAGELALQRLGPSLRLVVPAVVVAAAAALALGTFAALRPSKRRGRVIMAVAFVADGVPYFVVALVLVFAVTLRWLPTTGDQGFAPLVIPVVVLAVLGFATLARLVRGQLLDALGQGPVLYARSMGVPPRQVLMRHALPLAVPPLLSYLGIQFSIMFGSLLILEPMFDYEGLGGLLLSSVNDRDFPAVQACVFVIAVFVTVVNLAMDGLVRLIDPRLAKEVSA